LKKKTYNKKNHETSATIFRTIAAAKWNVVLVNVFNFPKLDGCTFLQMLDISGLEEDESQ